MYGCFSLFIFVHTFTCKVFCQMRFDALNSVHYHVGFYMYISPLYASPIVCFHMRDIRIYLWKCLDQKWYFVMTSIIVKMKTKRQSNKFSISLPLLLIWIQYYLNSLSIHYERPNLIYSYPCILTWQICVLFVFSRHVANESINQTLRPY